MNKRKVLSILLLALITVTLAVSCSGSIDAPVQDAEELAYVTFGNGHSRGLSTSYETEAYSNLFWFYTAQKTDSYGTTGQVGLNTERLPTAAVSKGDNNAPAKGLSGQVGPFSQGAWKFKLYAYAENATSTGPDKTNLIYASEEVAVTLKGNEVKNVPVSVAPRGSTGYVRLDNVTFNWKDGLGGASAPTGKLVFKGSNPQNNFEREWGFNHKVENNVNTFYLNGNLPYQITGEGSSAVFNYNIPADFYTVTATAYLVGTASDGTAINNEGTPLFRQTFGLRVYGNATTVISGDIVEGVNTTVTFDVADQAMRVFTKDTSSADRSTTVSVAVNPLNGNNESESLPADTQKTTVKFPDGALADAVHQLDVSVTPIASANQKFQVSGETNENTAVAGIDLTLVKVEENNGALTQVPVTSFGEETPAVPRKVTVTTYIARGLSSVQVKYLDSNGDPEHIAGPITEKTGTPSYDPDTGKLVFETSHFSQFVVVADVEALNVSTGIPYATLASAISAAGDGQEVRVMNDVILSDTVFVGSGSEVVLDLNGRKIETVTRPGDSTKHYYAIDNYGKITIEDSSADQKGTIDARGIENLGNGIMIINSGNFNSIDTNGGACVWNEAHLIINGGKFSTTHVGDPSDKVGVGCLNNSGSALITGGSFSDVNKRTYAIISTGEIEIIPGEGKEVKVTGAHGALAIDSGTGAVYGGDYSSTEYYGLYVSNDGQGDEPEIAAVTVYGGTFDGKNYSVWIGSDYNNPVNSTIEILGGTFSKPLNAQACTREGAIQVKGGTFSSDPKDYVAEGYITGQDNGKYIVLASLPQVDGEYTISNADELILFEKLVNIGNKSYSGEIVKLTGDINLSGKTWTPVGQTGATQFQGTFDGQGHTISNLTVNNTDESANCSTGLFGWLNNATVKNLTIDGSNVAGHHYVGVIAGYIETKNSVIESCHVKNATVSCTAVNSDANGDKCGGIVGYAGNTGTYVKNCTVSDSTISAGRDAGQVVGAAKTVNVSNCSASSVTVTANGTSTGANIRNEVIGRVL